MSRERQIAVCPEASDQTPPRTAAHTPSSAPVQAATRGFFGLPLEEKLKVRRREGCGREGAGRFGVAAAAPGSTPNCHVWSRQLQHLVNLTLQVKRTQTNPNGFFNDELTKQVRDLKEVGGANP